MFRSKPEELVILSNKAQREKYKDYSGEMRRRGLIGLNKRYYKKRWRAKQKAKSLSTASSTEGVLRVQE